MQKNEYGKIPLPWSSPECVRGKYSLVYWHMVRAWNGQSRTVYTVADLLDDANLILQNVDPYSQLGQRVDFLRSEVIMYGTKAKKGKVVNLHPPGGKPTPTPPTLIVL